MAVDLNKIIYPTTISTRFTSNSGIAIPNDNNINFVGGAGITTSASGTTVTIGTSGGSFGWTVVTSASNPVALVPENGYIAKGVMPVQFILPAASDIGDSYRIKGYGNLWTLSQNAFQFVTLGIAVTTSGIGGSIAATQIKDSIELLCVTANQEFDIIDSNGNPTFI